MRAGQLDRRIQFRRAALVSGATQSALAWTTANPSADNHGLPVWASRRDISDGERAAAGWIEATVVSRFVVRSSGFTRGITPKDRLVEGGLVYEITGVKELDRRGFLEITAVARMDL